MKDIAVLSFGVIYNLVRDGWDPKVTQIVTCMVTFFFFTWTERFSLALELGIKETLSLLWSILNSPSPLNKNSKKKEDRNWHFSKLISFIAINIRHLQTYLTVFYTACQIEL